MKKLFLVPVLFVLASCGDGEAVPGVTVIDSDQVDPLIATEILGTWELQSRSINTVSDPVVCCDTLIFRQDGLPTDLIGDFSRMGADTEMDGKFQLDEDLATVLFDFDNNAVTYEYLVDGTLLSFFYLEGDANIEERWIREEVTD